MLESLFNNVALESLFNNVAGLQETLIKLQIPAQVFSYKYCEISKKTCFEEHLRTACSEEHYIAEKKKLLNLKKDISLFPSRSVPYRSDNQGKAKLF